MTQHMSIVGTGTDLRLEPTPPEDFEGFVLPGRSATQADLDAAIAEAKQHALPLYEITSASAGGRINLCRAASAADPHLLAVMARDAEELGLGDLVATLVDA